MEQKKIEDYSTLELRAMKGDCYEKIEIEQNNLRIIVTELRRRVSQGVNLPPKEKEDQLADLTEEIAKKKQKDLLDQKAQ